MLFKKYPRTFHLSWSPGLSNDDKKLASESIFYGNQVVVTEKLDGENTGHTSKGCHARSLYSSDHPSRHWVKALNARIKNDIPEGWHFFGENVFAEHSIYYDRLTSFFYLFMIVDDKQECLSWKDTKEWADLLSLRVPPVIYEGIWDEEKIKACYTGVSAFGDVQEGYVVRNSKAFLLDEFKDNYGKYVRENHVTTDDFWMKTWKPNKLA